MLLSRTADSLFWTARYIERAENTARLLEAATRLSNVGGSQEQVSNEWESAVLATGMEELFEERYGEPTARTVVDFLAFSEANPSSIRSCLEAARANARSVRTAITIEMWETINAAWLELKRYRTFGQSRGELWSFCGSSNRSRSASMGSPTARCCAPTAFRSSSLAAPLNAPTTRRAFWT